MTASMFPKFTRTRLRRKVPKSCPAPRAHVRAALKAGRALDACTHDGVTVDPNTEKWWSAPAPRHMKVTPRWFNMDIGDNGRVTTRAAKKEEYSDPIPEMDYASTTIIWSAKEPNSLI